MAAKRTLPPVVTVTEAREADAELFEAVHRLLPQLSSSARQPTDDEIAEIVGSPATVLLVARDDALAPVEGGAGEASRGAAGAGGPIVGMLTLVIFRLPTGVRAWVEDVVVDTAARRRGIAEALTRAAVGLARARAARTLDLTSRPARDAATNLYQKVGFEERNTNVFRLALGTDGRDDQHSQHDQHR